MYVYIYIYISRTLPPYLSLFLRPYETNLPCPIKTVHRPCALRLEIFTPPSYVPHAREKFPSRSRREAVVFFSKAKWV